MSQGTTRLRLPLTCGAGGFLSCRPSIAPSSSQKRAHAASSYCSAKPGGRASTAAEPRKPTSARVPMPVGHGKNAVEKYCAKALALRSHRLVLVADAFSGRFPGGGGRFLPASMEICGFVYSSIT